VTEAINIATLNRHQSWSAKANQTFTVQMQVVVAGVTDPGVIDVHFYASTDTVIASSDYYLGRTEVSLSSKEAVILTWRGTFPKNVPSGSYYVGWIIDPDNRFAEDNKANNIAYKRTPLLQVTGQSPSVVYVDGNAHGPTVAWTGRTDAEACRMHWPSPGRAPRFVWRQGLTPRIRGWESVVEIARSVSSCPAV